MDQIQSHLWCNIFEIGVILIEFLERAVHFLTRLRIVVPGDSLHLDIAKQVLVSMRLRKIPSLQWILDAILLQIAISKVIINEHGQN